MSVTVQYRGALRRPPAPSEKAEGRPKKPNDALAAAPRPTRAARMLALAYLIERRIEEGTLRDYADAACRLGVTRARVAQIMDLRGLPAAVQERIVIGEPRRPDR